MPLYEYLCTECDASTDVFATLAEKEAGLQVPCASCGSGRTRRALSTIAVRGRASAAATAPSTGGGGGGCCGGGCCG